MSQKATKSAQKSQVRTHQLGQEVFKAILPEDIDWKPFAAFHPLFGWLSWWVNPPRQPPTQSG